MLKTALHKYIYNASRNQEAPPPIPLYMTETGSPETQVVNIESTFNTVLRRVYREAQMGRAGSATRKAAVEQMRVKYLAKVRNYLESIGASPPRPSEESNEQRPATSSDSTTAPTGTSQSLTLRPSASTTYASTWQPFPANSAQSNMAIPRILTTASAATSQNSPLRPSPSTTPANEPPGPPYWQPTIPRATTSQAPPQGIPAPRYRLTTGQPSTTPTVTSQDLPLRPPRATLRAGTPPGQTTGQPSTAPTAASQALPLGRQNEINRLGARPIRDPGQLRTSGMARPNPAIQRSSSAALARHFRAPTHGFSTATTRRGAPLPRTRRSSPDRRRSRLPGINRSCSGQ